MVRSGATYVSPGYPGSGTWFSTFTSKRSRACAAAALAAITRSAVKTARLTAGSHSRRDDLGRRALSRAHGAVHVAVPVGRSLGARPVDSADRRAQCRAEVEQRSRAEHRDGTAARPLLLRPVLDHEVVRVRRLVAEVVDEVRERRLLDL